MDTPAFSVSGLAATGNAAVRKSTLVLFINGRAAECAPLRAAVESAYVALHSKAATFWVCIDARVPPGHVDVNIHPTKTEVALLFQPELIEAARSALERVLEGAHNVRSFARSGPTQQPISGAYSDAYAWLRMGNTCCTCYTRRHGLPRLHCDSLFYNASFWGPVAAVISLLLICFFTSFLNPSFVRITITRPTPMPPTLEMCCIRSLNRSPLCRCSSEGRAAAVAADCRGSAGTHNAARKSGRRPQARSHRPPRALPQAVPDRRSRHQHGRRRAWRGRRRWCRRGGPCRCVGLTLESSRSPTVDFEPPKPANSSFRCEVS